jgi:hypothetical protein
MLILVLLLPSYCISIKQMIRTVRDICLQKTFYLAVLIFTVVGAPAARMPGYEKMSTDALLPMLQRAFVGDLRLREGADCDERSPYGGRGGSN